MGLNRGSKGLTECIISFCVCHENQVKVYPTLIFSFLYKFTFSFLVLLSQHKNRIASIIWKKNASRHEYSNAGKHLLVPHQVFIYRIQYMVFMYILFKKNL